MERTIEKVDEHNFKLWAPVVVSFELAMQKKIQIERQILSLQKQLTEINGDLEEATKIGVKPREVVKPIPVKDL